MTRTMHMGRGGSMIDQFMQPAIGDTSAASWTATATITRGGGAKAYNPTTHLDESPARLTIMANGGRPNCRIQARPVNDATQMQAGQEVTTMEYLVVVAVEIDAHVDDSVLIADASDPNLIGKRLTVQSVGYGSIAVERDLRCSLDAG